ncbi:MAG: hypothetical protein ACFE9R_06865 [Candidatus Hermodarchaeota archaeon]
MTDISLKVNDTTIPLNELMESMLTNLMLGYLKSAKNIPEEIRKIEIEISF